MHVEIPRVATYFSQQNKIGPLGIFSYMGYFPDGILSSGILSSWDFFLWDFFLWDFFLMGFFPTWDFVLMGFYPDTIWPTRSSSMKRPDSFSNIFFRGDCRNYRPIRWVGKAKVFWGPKGAFPSRP